MNTVTRNAGRLPWVFPVLIFLLLSMAGCRSAGDRKKPAATPLTDVTWQWVEFVEQDGGDMMTVPNPEKYTIVFREDGTYHGMADCNPISGSYAQVEGFKILPGPSTMAYCGEHSLDKKYVELLGLAVAGGLDGNGRLVLEPARGTIRIIFRNGGVAP